MAVSSGFFNAINGDRKYNAVQISELFDGLIQDGVCVSGGVGGDAFAVTQNTVPDLHVQVGEGRAWFKHTWTKNDAHILLDIETPDILYARIDAVVLEVNRSDAIRANSIKVIKGTPAEAPQEPQMQHTGTLDQYRLANIAVAANDTEIINANITYKVGTVETPFLANMVNPTFDVETLLAQWDSYFDNTWLPAREAEFDNTWLPAKDAEVDAWLAAKETELDGLFDDWLSNLVVMETLEASRTYYVRTDGNDSNDGLTNTSGGAWLTIQHAINVVTQTLVLGPHTVTIGVNAGTYNESIVLKPYITSGGIVQIIGVSETSTIINSPGYGINADNCGYWYLKELKVIATSSDAIYAWGSSDIELYHIRFGNAATFHCHARGGAIIRFSSDSYTIMGNAIRHIYASRGGKFIIANPLTVYIDGLYCTGFTTFAEADLGGLIEAANVTFNGGGSVTGTRYRVKSNAVIFTNGGGANYFPGNASGVSETGGQYI